MDPTVLADSTNLLPSFISTLVGLIPFVVGFGLFHFFSGHGQLNVETETERLRAELSNTSEWGDASPEGPGGATDEVLTRLFRDYAAHGLAQSRVSFRFSLIFAVAGFLVICTGIGVALFGDQTSDAVIPLIGGTVVDAVAGLFFINNSNSKRVMIEFFDKIREDRNISRAVALSHGLEGDARLGADLQALLALHFAGASDIEHKFAMLRRSEEGDRAGRVPPAHDTSARPAKTASSAGRTSAQRSTRNQ